MTARPEIDNTVAPQLAIKNQSPQVDVHLVAQEGTSIDSKLINI